ncbi:hypothetical protein DITRI_Ditri17bG0044800 [Diplodiscus trichospermus]
MENYLGKDWRANLFTVFVDNLSRRVSKSALWKAFGAYGGVVDVFIASSPKGRRHKETTFAFVRNTYGTEMQRAAERGNHRLVDGRHILVKMASFGWKEKKGDVVIGYIKANVGRKIRDANPQQDGIIAVERNSSTRECSTEIIFDLDILSNEMEWWDRCAIGQVKDPSNMNLVYTGWCI